MKIGQYAKNVFVYLLTNNMLSKTMKINLEDKDYCSNTFSLSYAVLTKSDKNIQYYYSNLFIDGYVICREWKERSRPKLEQWLRDNNLLINASLLPLSVKQCSIGKFPFNHYDRDCDLVRYADNVAEQERVEGLCRQLQDWYYKVRDYLCHVSGDDLFYNLPLIPVILSKKRPMNTVKHDVAEWIKTSVDKYGKDLSKERIQYILDHQIEEYPVLGRFIYKTEKPYIEIYYTNINIKDYREYIDYMCGILAHEYFHYYHYRFVANKTFSDTSWKAVVVKEALAEIFFYLCLEHYDTSTRKFKMIIDERFEAWELKYGSKWPYAYALDFFNPRLDLKKINEVIKLSSYDMEAAYNRLKV